MAGSFHVLGISPITVVVSWTAHTLHVSKILVLTYPNITSKIHYHFAHSLVSETLYKQRNTNATLKSREQLHTQRHGVRRFCWITYMMEPPKLLKITHFQMLRKNGRYKVVIEPLGKITISKQELTSIGHQLGGLCHVPDLDPLLIFT